jgi:hypothetical protein
MSSNIIFRVNNIFPQSHGVCVCVCVHVCVWVLLGREPRALCVLEVFYHSSYTASPFIFETDSHCYLCPGWPQIYNPPASFPSVPGITL